MYKIIDNKGNCYTEFPTLPKAEAWLRHHHDIFPEHCELKKFKIKHQLSDGKLIDCGKPMTFRTRR